MWLGFIGGLGFVGFRVHGLGFKVWGLKFGIRGLGFVGIGVGGGLRFSVCCLEPKGTGIGEPARERAKDDKRTGGNSKHCTVPGPNLRYPLTLNAQP